MSRYSKRRDKLRRQLRKNKIDALLVTNFKNVSYLTGFTGDDSYLLVTLKHEVLISDMRFTIQIQEECPEIEVLIRGPGRTMHAGIKEMITKYNVTSLAFESTALTVAEYDSFSEHLRDCDLIAADSWVEQIRLIKDASEIERIRVACDQARRSFETVRAMLTLDMTELDVANNLEYQARRFGGRCLSFTPIVGVGERAALPHGHPTEKKIGEDAFTLIDWGVNEGQYVSDLTRILVTGKISPKLRKLYGIVLKAQVAAIDAIRPGIPCETVDKIARDIITKAGFGKNFGHGLGHGIGLDVHEAPRLSKSQKTPLAPGMVVTVEPGIYLPGWGGIRIEDDVLVTRKGHEVLSTVPKQLDECVVQ